MKILKNKGTNNGTIGLSQIVEKYGNIARRHFNRNIEQTDF